MIRVRRTSSSQSRAGIFVVGLPHPRSQFLLVLDHPIVGPSGNGMASFLTLGGLKRPEDNPTLKMQGPAQLLQYGREHLLHCTVAVNEIRVTLDAQTLIEYRGEKAVFPSTAGSSVPCATPTARTCRSKSPAPPARASTRCRSIRSPRRIVGITCVWRYLCGTTGKYLTRRR